MWKLKSYARRFLDTGDVCDDEPPHAYLLYTPGGHMMSVTVEARRRPPAEDDLTDEERIRLFRTIVSAQAGKYTVAGDTVTHQVELSWNEKRTGTNRMRCSSAAGDTLALETMPMTAAPGARPFVGTLVWERVEVFPFALS